MEMAQSRERLGQADVRMGKSRRMDGKTQHVWGKIDMRDIVTFALMNAEQSVMHKHHIGEYVKADKKKEPTYLGLPENTVSHRAVTIPPYKCAGTAALPNNGSTDMMRWERSTETKNWRNSKLHTRIGRGASRTP